ncbi:MAG: HIRAN domain-containing protein [Fimbriimonadaceae bacterium]|nr:HIRAN domain-containing protein [Chitinophagales bacterium]
MVEQYKKIYLLQCFIKGFQYYNGPGLLNEMHKGGMLELVRERNNEHDANAIAIHFNEQKIGFIPAAENHVLSKIMDTEILELQAEFTHIEKSAATWENVHIAVYVLKRTNDPLPDQAAYTEQLITPTYLTLGYINEHVMRIKRDKENTEAQQVHVLVDFTKTAEKILKRKMQQHEEIFVVNKNRIPEKYRNDSLLHTLNNAEITLDKYFDEEGYIVASVDRLSQLDSEIKTIVIRKTTNGKDVFEALFE